SAAGDVSWMVGIVEDNFLGTATSLTAVHNHTPDRNIFDLHYQSPHFFGRRTRLALAYSNKSDGSSGSWAIGVPFYETAARRALETGGSAGSERVLIFRDGALDTTLAHRTLRSEEHTSELQSRFDLVCRLLLEKKNHVEIRPRLGLEACVADFVTCLTPVRTVRGELEPRGVRPCPAPVCCERGCPDAVHYPDLS